MSNPFLKTQSETLDYFCFFSTLHFSPIAKDKKMYHLQELALDAKKKFAALEVQQHQLNQLPYGRRKQKLAGFKTQLKEYQGLLQKIRLCCLGYMEELLQSDRQEQAAFLLNFLPMGPLRDYYHAKFFDRYQALKQDLFARQDVYAKLAYDDPAYITQKVDIALIQKKLASPAFAADQIDKYEQGKQAFLKDSYPSVYADEALYLKAKFANRPELLSQCSPEYLPAVCAMAVDFPQEPLDQIALDRVHAAAKQHYLPALIFTGERLLATVNTEAHQPNDNSDPQFLLEASEQHDIAVLKQGFRRLKSEVEPTNCDPHYLNNTVKNICQSLPKFQQLKHAPQISKNVSELSEKDTYIPGEKTWRSSSIAPFFLRTTAIRAIDTKVKEYEALSNNGGDVEVKKQKCSELKADVSKWLTGSTFFTPRNRSVKQLSRQIEREQELLQSWLLSKSRNEHTIAK